MEKAEFLQELEEIIEDKLYIGNTEEDLNQEISQNTWSISMSQELANEFSVDDLRTFLNSVLMNRKNQILNSDCNHGMIFYVWFEWQSARLRFNLISDVNLKLPFGGKYKIIEKLDPILIEFLNFPYHDGFPIEEVEVGTEDNEEEPEIVPFEVYQVRISKKA